MLSRLPEPNEVIAIDLPKVAKNSLLITIASLFLLWALHIAIVQKFSIAITLWSAVLLIVGYIILIVLHELFHLLGFRLFGGVPWKKMIVGVNLKLGVAYATTDQLMTNQAIRRALLLPFWITGVVPAIIGLATGNGLLINLAALLIGGAAGDFAMYKELRKLPGDWLVKDDPELPQLYVYAADTLDK